MKDSRVALTAIAAITVIEIFALHKGIDGVMLSLSIGAISGIAGFKVKNILNGKNGNT